MEQHRCDKCGSRLIWCYVGGKIPWLACPICNKEELKQAKTKRV